jgi:hypothetical protein
VFHRRPPERIELEVREITEGEEYVAYHVVKTDDRDDPAFEESFTSRRALGLPPRLQTQEGPNPEVADGISAYKTADAASDSALAAIKRGKGFGEFVAELHLQPGNGIRIAEWGRRGHLTIWADPLILCSSATDIVRIEVPQ